MEFAAEKWDGRDGAERDNWDGDIGDSRLVNLRFEKESQHQDNPPVNGENHKRVAGDVSQNAFGDADGGDVWELACQKECSDESDNACDGTSDKLGEALAQVVVHDAEIRTRRFQKSIGDKADDSDGCDEGCIFRGVRSIRGNGTVNFFDGFFAEPTASEEE